MDIKEHRSAQIVAFLLLAVVVTQIIYFALSSNGSEINRMIIWSTEAVAFLGISVFALACLVRSPRHALAWAAIAVSGVLNTIQVGMGLAMFEPLSEAGEAMAPAFQSILAGAFFLFFAGKFLFGLSAILIGAALLRGGRAAKAIGVVTVLAGLVSIAVNLGAMATGMTLIFAAGAAGTVATLVLGIAVAMSVRDIENVSAKSQSDF